MLPTQFSGFAQIVQTLPLITESLLKCDELIRENEEKQAMRYSDQEYLKSVHRLYKTGKISGDDALKAMEIIFRKQKTIEAKYDPIEQQLLKMIGME